MEPGAGIRCPKCNETVTTDASDCPGCGAALRPDPTGRTVPVPPDEFRGQPTTPVGEPTDATRAPVDPAYREPSLDDDGNVRPEDRDLIGNHELIRKLGGGGMGSVYLARQISMDRLVALKVLRRELAADEDYVERFIREARLAGKLEHPNIVRALNVGQAGGIYCLSMDYVEGLNVGERLAAKGALPEAEALDVLRQIASALKYAHENSVIHRDIKPDNILVTRSGVAKLTDLGLAKDTSGSVDLTQSGSMMGTPMYMSPEQVRGESNLDIRTDIYSLGATLYHVVTGKPPFTGPSPALIMTKRLDSAPPSPCEANPLVSAACGALVLHMMAIDPADRYPDPAALLLDVEAVIAGRMPAGPPRAEKLDDGEEQIAADKRMRVRGPDRKPSPTRRITTVHAVSPRARRRWAFWLLLPVLIVASVTAAGFTMYAPDWRLLREAEALYGSGDYAQARSSARRIKTFWLEPRAKVIVGDATLKLHELRILAAERKKDWRAANAAVKKLLADPEYTGEQQWEFESRQRRYAYRLNCRRAAELEEEGDWAAALKAWNRSLEMLRDLPEQAADAHGLRQNRLFCIYVTIAFEKKKAGDLPAVSRALNLAKNCRPKRALPADVQYMIWELQK